jgi:proteasome assembly chaperone (PAC2) family protein
MLWSECQFLAEDQMLVDEYGLTGMDHLGDLVADHIIAVVVDP